MAIAFERGTRPQYGELETISPLVRRMVARNPSAFTLHGTGTYVIGHGKVAVIDAGPALRDHVDALVEALGGEQITHQFVTHTHADHSPAATTLRELLGARTYGYGPHGEGSYERGQRVEAGADRAFEPDERVRDGDVIEGDGWSLECVHTPGHCSNHLCFALREEQTLFSGDHVMGWSTSVISPPDGDMTDYMASLALLLERDDRVYRPTHGPAIEDPKPLVRAFIDHRQDRERQVLDCLEQGVDRIVDMVALMYKDTPAILHPAAARSVFAHIIDLVERGALKTDGTPALDAVYRLK